MIVQEFDIKKIDSLTKYPSIETYHKLGDRGILTETLNQIFHGQLFVTEKIDGTNARVILLPDGTWLIGQRDGLLTFKNDIVRDNSNGIVPALLPHADRIQEQFGSQEDIVVVYMEVYGGNINNWKNYTTDKKTTGWRIFDVAVLPYWREPLTTWTRDRIATWRQNGGQGFLSRVDLLNACQHFPMVPDICTIIAGEMPVSVADTHEWLKSLLTETQAALTDDAQKRPEGVVVRSMYRNAIAKIRFEDYERTMRKREQK